MHSKTELATAPIARRPARKGKTEDRPRATHSGILNLAGHKLHCVVLEDGRRVLSQKSLGKAIGRTGNDASIRETPAFLIAANLKPFVAKALSRSAMAPIIYSRDAGGIGHGYEARVLPAVCRVYLDARRAGALHAKQRKIADACEILLTALADVGIVALVDEATGFQDSRAQDALQKLLAKYVSRELARWTRTFEVDFYRHIYRLRGWPFDPASSTRTPMVARLTIDLVYDRIHPDLLRELKRVRGDGNRPNTKLHQWLTVVPDGGHPRLKQHLEGVVALLSVAMTWEQFEEWLDLRYPKYANDAAALPCPG